MPASRVTHEQSDSVLLPSSAARADAVARAAPRVSLVYCGLLAWLFGIAVYTAGIGLSLHPSPVLAR